MVFHDYTKQGDLYWDPDKQGWFPFPCTNPEPINGRVILRRIKRPRKRLGDAFTMALQNKLGAAV